MESENNQQIPDETTISVTAFEATLIANILQVAMSNIRMHPASRKRVQDFKLRLQKAGLEITKRYLDSLPRIP